MDDLAWLQGYVRDIPDFPEPGIVFKDLTPLLGDPGAFGASVDEFAGYAGRLVEPITKVVGIEARGFTFAAAVAYKLGVGLIPVRKPGKLPHETMSETYALEYGIDTLEIHRDAVAAEGEAVLVVDDVLATGGTAAATCRLLESVGGRVAGLAFVVELGFLQGRAKLLDYDVFTLLTF